MTAEEIKKFRSKLTSMVGSLIPVSTVEAGAKGRFKFEIDEDFEDDANPRGFFITESPKKMAYNITLAGVANGLVWIGSATPKTENLKKLTDSDKARDDKNIATFKQHIQSQDNPNFNLLEVDIKVEALVPTFNYNVSTTASDKEKLLYPVQSYQGYDAYREALSKVPMESDTFTSAERGRAIRQLRIDHLYKSGLNEGITEKDCIKTPIYRIV